MARPVTMMSAALLTAAASGILPHLMPLSTTGQPVSVSAVAPAFPNYSGMPSTLPSTIGPPFPLNTVQGGSSPPAGQPFTAPASASHGNSRIMTLSGNGTIIFRQSGNNYVSYLSLRSLSGLRQRITIELALLQDRNGAPVRAEIASPLREGFGIEPFGSTNQLVEMMLPTG